MTPHLPLSPLARGALLLVLLAALALRLDHLTANGLWMDEVFGASYTNLGPIDTLVAVLRFDIHPPMYYWQLNLWAQLVGHGDVALLANSVLWSTAGIGMLFIWLRQTAGLPTAFAAALIMSTAWGSVAYAQELRMYAFMSFWALLAAWSADASARQGVSRYGQPELLLGASMVVLTLSHSLSIIPVTAVFCYWLARCAEHRTLSIRRASWLTLAVGTFMLPVLANAAMRSVSHTREFDYSAVLSTIANWFWGHAQTQTWSGPTAAVLLAAALLFCVARPGPLRAVAIAFVVFPLVAVGAMSLLLRPVWLDRSFAFAAPFVYACVASLLVGHLGTPAAWRLVPRTAAAGQFAVAGLAIACAAGTYGELRSERKMQYREAAAFLQREWGAADIVYIPDRTTFWGIARYRHGPAWGSVLAMQDPVLSDKSTTWTGVYSRLGPVWLQRLGLTPKGRVLHVDSQSLIVGWSELPAQHRRPTIAVVGPNGFQPESLRLCAAPTVKTQRFRGLAAHLVSCPVTSEPVPPSIATSAPS